ncbi:guanidinobutyrase-like [Portunus trituberculatus]|uniref:guanidinobutyrase-like n=1 Tax=Portunus trituberculatus TaxID=210409 RepID=UPI001E1D05B9|nr:guanidinobutyrase-like [Portunus trituberculatus]
MFGVRRVSVWCHMRGFQSAWSGYRLARQQSSPLLTTSTQDVRQLHTSSSKSERKLNQPIVANQMPRPGGIPSFMRLPIQQDTKGLDACFVGVPLDIGCSNRTGTRFGPRYLRCESPQRPVNQGTGVNPFLTHNVADIGDVFINLYNLPEACRNIREQYQNIISNKCIPLTMGGDHTISYPILQAMKDKYGPVGLIHVDAHPDLQDEVLGSPIGHGTPFKRAYDEGLLDCSRVIQIGLRGTGYSSDDCNIGRNLGFRVVGAQECWYKSLEPLMAEVREQMGEGPVYLSFDIDAIDPCYCPGTGTPEVGGLTSIQALEIVRGCRGLNLVGCDLVEVSPPYDVAGMTAGTGAHLLFEMLCVLPGTRCCD